jgi:hypothetical protein
MRGQNLKVLGVSISNRQSLGGQKPRYNVELQGVFISRDGTKFQSFETEILGLYKVSGHLLQALLADLEFLEFEIFDTLTSSPISSQELPSGDPELESPSTVSEGSDE